MTRRTFVLILGGVGLWTAGRLWGPLGEVFGRVEADPVAVKLADVFTHARSARVVGFEYLAGVPREADARLLVDLICSFRGERRAELAGANLATRRRLLAAQQREDFEQGRVVNVQGWILSETEARLCALAALA